MKRILEGPVVVEALVTGGDEPVSTARLFVLILDVDRLSLARGQSQIHTVTGAGFRCRASRVATASVVGVSAYIASGE